MNSRFLKPGHKVHTVAGRAGLYRAISLDHGPTEIREVRYAYPAGNAGKARTYVEFTDGMSGEFPTNAFWIVED